MEVLRISTVVDALLFRVAELPLEVLRISTVVDSLPSSSTNSPLEVLRISTVVDVHKLDTLEILLWKC